MLNKATEIDTTRDVVYGFEAGKRIVAIDHSCEECHFDEREEVTEVGRVRQHKVFECMQCGSLMKQKIVWANEPIKPKVKDAVSGSGKTDK